MNSPASCSVDGCQRKHQARGLCHTHYVQGWRSGDIVALPPRDLSWEALEARGVRDGECLRWSGRRRNENGYARVNWGGRSHQVHRLAYELRTGTTIPDGIQIDHVVARGCRHRDCFNPDHLEPVTPQENVRRQARHTASVCPRGHQRPEPDSAGFRRCVECSRERSMAKVVCECGASVSRNNLRVHRSRQVHITRMEELR